MRWRLIDFIDANLGKAIPYGIYDPAHNLGWVSVGTDHSTAQFAVRSIRRWWEAAGEWLYPGAEEIMIMADGGGSNGSRCRLWKKCLQDWADEEGLSILVCHLPPGTSKWNKIEHRMFCHITRNWRGRPLVSHEVIIELIGATTTEKGLSIRAEMDTGKYPNGIQVSDEEMEALALERADFHGEWNYLIKPRVL
ncbi:MAG: Rhodopirellula transposase family protein [Verrucomicrobiales bacterium]|nr:Rhodopirellula transposase family protein [Verrucomicrobiales bacterium]